MAEDIFYLPKFTDHDGYIGIKSYKHTIHVGELERIRLLYTWFEENNIQLKETRIWYDPYYDAFEFVNEEDFMAFKLAWL